MNVFKFHTGSQNIFGCKTSCHTEASSLTWHLKPREAYSQNTPCCPGHSHRVPEALSAQKGRSSLEHTWRQAVHNLLCPGRTHSRGLVS